MWRSLGLVAPGGRRHLAAVWHLGPCVMHRQSVQEMPPEGGQGDLCVHQYLGEHSQEEYHYLCKKPQIQRGAEA